MDQRTPSFESLSPRFRGFDAYFDAEIAPHAPALLATLPPLWDAAAGAPCGAARLVEGEQ